MSEGENWAEVQACPKCGCASPQIKIHDDRVQFYVQCPVCDHTVIGDNVKHLDDIEDDKKAQAAFDAVNWELLAETAVKKWNEQC